MIIRRIRKLAKRAREVCIVALHSENPREQLLKMLELRGYIHPSWYDMFNSSDVISNDVHVPELDPHTSQEEYMQIQRLEGELSSITRRFAAIGAFAVGSEYYTLADFLREAHRAVVGARQQYEQRRFGKGSVRVSARPEDVEEAAAAAEARREYEENWEEGEADYGRREE